MWERLQPRGQSTSRLKPLPQLMLLLMRIGIRPLGRDAMQTAYISHPLCLKHDMGAHHPESPARIHAIEDQLIAAGLMDYLQRHDAPEATREQLLRAHAAGYVDAIAAAAPKEGMGQRDPG